MKTENIKGVVFNVQPYSIHDGPGIRTTVFLKGCPLRCLWCQNPESQSHKPVIFFNPEKCTGCGNCLEVCPAGAIQIFEDKSTTDRTRCEGSGKCAAACPQEARLLMGEHVTAGEIFERVNADAIFYENSGGGITISGGDPVGQPDFTAGILKLCHQAGIHTAIDTCGFIKWDIFKRILTHVDLVLFDFKHMDDTRHKSYTGVSNTLILENAKRIHHDLRIPLKARIPIIPGYNDSTENIEATAKFIAEQLDKTITVHLVPYHRMGEGKYNNMEQKRPDFTSTPPDEHRMDELQQIFKKFGLTSVIGG
ncbi:glycyl-radical enzyme activating protein [Desulfobacula sp.]|uniref:glycyl-radical enzyme activating protein n=1 Tax=Desulfobacula sp. TaxID=2593537 RepID=UPI00260A6DA6|nr:glycyl-radical enzyme activating protein [Desulfobacula sp.]